MRWLIWRNFLSSARDPRETRISFIQTLVIKKNYYFIKFSLKIFFFSKMFAVVFGLIYLQIALDQSGVQNINGVLFLMLTNTSFSNLFPVLTSFPPLIPIFLREHANGMYRVVNFYLARFLTEVCKRQQTNKTYYQTTWSTAYLVAQVHHFSFHFCVHSLLDGES